MTDLSFKVIGATDFRQLAAVLKETELGNKLVKYIADELKPAAEPAMDAARKNAAAILPKRGGLADLVASADLKVSTRRTTRAAGVRITASKPGMSQLEDIDRGKVRHPVYDKNVYVTQVVPRDWFTGPMLDHAKDMEAAVTKAVTHLIGDIERG